jgi:hypothetical protein
VKMLHASNHATQDCKPSDDYQPDHAIEASTCLINGAPCQLSVPPFHRRSTLGSQGPALHLLSQASELWRDNSSQVQQPAAATAIAKASTVIQNTD